MKSRARFTIRSVCIIALAGAIAVLIFNQESIARARTEQQSLLQEKQECERLAVDNAELDSLQTVNETVKKLRAENQDLPRLRNEVRNLRKQADEAAKLRAENRQLSSRLEQAVSTVRSLPADYVHRASIADVGFSTPEAAVETFLHAMTQGDIHRLNQCAVQPDDHGMTEEQIRSEAKKMQEHFAAFPGYRISKKEIISAEEVKVGIESAVGGVSMPMTLKFIGGEWKVAGH